jgi:beta-lactamase class A
MGVGIGAIAGTALTVIEPNTILAFHSAKANKSQKPQASKPSPSPKPETTQQKLTLTEELTPLKQKLTTLTAKYPKLTPELYFVDLDNGAYVNLGGENPVPAASTIKVPLLIAFFQDVDAGKIRLDEILTAKKELIASGSGDMQYQGVGKKYTALETATKMIIISDNTATNMLIERLGGKEVLNQRFQQLGLTATVIKNPLPDLEGTNTTSPKDLANLLIRVSQGELLSLKSRDRLLGIMQETKTRTLLPQGLEENAVIAHKTGDIGTVLGDVGIVDMPSGKRYVGAVLAKRPYNDPKGRDMIQEISRTVYQHLKWYQVKPAATPTPTPSVSPKTVSSPIPPSTPKKPESSQHN